MPPVAVEDTAPIPADPADALLVRAGRAEPGQRLDLLLDAAGALVDRKDIARAKAVLEDAAALPASPEQDARRAILLSDVLATAGDPAGALAALPEPGETPETVLPRALEAGLLEARARALFGLGRSLEAARQRVALQPWLPDDKDRIANARHILDSLGLVSLGELDKTAASAGSDDWRGWLELSLIARDMRRSPLAQKQRLHEWEQTYAANPAFGDGMHGLIEGLAGAIAEPARVALLLPLTGRAGASGQAVLQGYLAEHYRELGAGEPVPPLAIVDTGGTAEGFAAAYRRTTGDGADVVIGPLLKEELAAFGSGLPASVPTLALNFLDAPSAAIPGVHQFGVDPSDEVAQLASDSRNAGMSRAVVLADAAPRSRRLVEDFGSRWRNAGGELIDTLYLGDLNEYRLSLERTLHLDQSHQRSVALGQLLGLELQTEPRRRADVDMVVLLAEPAGARSIRALLPFLYSGDVPVRGISMSYAGGAGREGDFDLETLKFVDMPWFSNAEQNLRETTSLQHGAVERLIALGVDARRLQSRINLLDKPGSWRLGGAAGELSTGTDGRVHRRAVWYVIEGGQAKAELSRQSIEKPTSRDGVQVWTPGDGTPPQTSGAPPKTEP